MQRVLEEVAEIEPDGGADQRAEQRSNPTDRGLHHELTRGVERESVGRHESLHHAKQAASEAGIGGGNYEGRQLIALDVVADRSGAQRIVAYRSQDSSNRRSHDPQSDDGADEVTER